MTLFLIYGMWVSVAGAKVLTTVTVFKNQGWG